MSEDRNGIICAGNWIVDKIKIVDQLPVRGMLANILSESLSTGGAPANVLGDLALMGSPFPLAGAGIVGDDEAGEYIYKTFKKLSIDTGQISKVPGVYTSYTDVMTENSTGNRTFFHFHGANDKFDIEHINLNTINHKILHLGYLSLLARMDEKDNEFGTVAARLLKMVQDTGIKTSVDVVSVQGDILPAIVPPALKYVDYLIINEIEIGLISGVKVRDKDKNLIPEAVRESVEKVTSMGNMEFITVHMPEGCYMRMSNASEYSSGSLILPQGYIHGAVGAGDAFCAGMLYSIHEEWSPQDCINLGTCCAAACLSKSDASSGLKPLKEVMHLSEEHKFRPPPIIC